MPDFTKGEQPCQQFNPQLDGFHMTNVHCCFGPYNPLRGKNALCEGKVSFCLYCHYDHHSDGWDSCPQRKTAE